jgi:response regulator RpfG family c-di-GMP phosphodiesterase
MSTTENTTKPTTVLLVDDDRQEYRLIVYQLSEVHLEDYRLIWCKNIRKALQYIEAETCDLVLFDYHFGGSGRGREFLA